METKRSRCSNALEKSWLDALEKPLLIALEKSWLDDDCGLMEDDLTAWFIGDGLAYTRRNGSLEMAWLIGEEMAH